MLPNLLSLLRIVIAIAIPFFLYLPQSLEGSSLWIALVLFALGAFTDFLDGWWARRQHLETPAGRILDPTADKILNLTTMSCFAARGLYSYWWLVPIFLREIAITFCRIVWLREGQAVGAERAGKIKLGLQVLSILLSFLALMIPNSVTLYLNYVFLMVAVYVTVQSGASFLKNNRKLLAHPALMKAAATMGVGHLRPAPGTYGSLLGLLVVLLVHYDPLLHLVILVFSIWLNYAAISRLGLAKEDDPAEIVIDEFSGMILAFLTVPLSLSSLFFGFLLFRLFDITKIFPINWLEKKKGTNGILWDDLGAGVYTWLILKWIYG